MDDLPYNVPILLRSCHGTDLHGLHGLDVVKTTKLSRETGSASSAKCFSVVLHRLDKDTVALQQFRNKQFLAVADSGDCRFEAVERESLADRSMQSFGRRRKLVFLESSWQLLRKLILALRHSSDLLDHLSEVIRTIGRMPTIPRAAPARQCGSFLNLRRTAQVTQNPSFTSPGLPLVVMAREIVLLYPVDIIDRRLDGPVYGELVGSQGGDRYVRLLVEAGADIDAVVTVPSSILDSRRVASDELGHGMPGTLLFRPVIFLHSEGLHHGQVTSYGDGHLTVQTASGDLLIDADAVVEVAPVSAILLWQVTLAPAISTLEDLEAAHALILDRLLGLNGHKATKSISHLLHSIAQPGAVPSPNDVIDWVCPRTGERRVVRVGHAVDFAFYVDGERRVPSTVRLGATFCSSPTTARGRSQARLPQRRQFRTQPARVATSAPMAAAGVEDGDDEGEDERFGNLLTALSASEGPTSKRRRVERASAGSVFDNPSTRAILDALAPYPHLLAEYTSQLNGLQSGQSEAVATEAPAARSQSSNFVNSQPHIAPSDLVPLDEHSARLPQHCFRPTTAQAVIHHSITAPDHAGKSADSFMDHARNSTSTKFLPHPAVLSRLYDFQFGPCGLSVLHFRRFDLNAQLEQAATRPINLRNFKLDLPEVTSSPRHHDLVDALSVLTTYADEFFDRSTRRLLTTAKDFAEELKDYGPWSPAETQLLVHGFGRVLAAYRLSVTDDVRERLTKRDDVWIQFSLQDPSFSGLLLKMSRSASPAARVPVALASGNHPGPNWQTRTERPAAQGARQKNPRVPSDLKSLIPRHNGRQLCLKFASAPGCPSPYPDRCVQPYLSHFEPASLPPQVVSYVRERYGALARKFETL